MQSTVHLIGEGDKADDSITFCAPGKLVVAFQLFARGTYGATGVSKAGREAMGEYLAKRGVKVGDDATLRNQRRLAELIALAELGVDIDAELSAMRLRAAQNAGEAAQVVPFPT